MALDLLDLAKGYLGDTAISQIGKMLGEKQGDTQKALDGALPVILNGLVQKSSEPGGTSSIMDLIGEVMAPDRAAGEAITPSGGILSNLGGLFSDSGQSSTLLTVGSKILRSLFGDKVGAVTDAIASFSGVKQSSASSLLGIAGPVLLSVLGKKMADDGTGVSGLASLLSSQSGLAKAALPSGLGSLLGAIPGLSFLSGIGGKIGDLTSSVRESVSRPTPPPTVDVPPTRYDDDNSSGGGNRWLPWLLLALGAVALFFLLRSCNKDKVAESTTAVTDSMSVMADSASSSIGAGLDSAGTALKEATAKLGAFFKRKLPSGLELNIPELGIENKLIKFIEDKSKPVDKTTWFNFDRLLFDTGKATLRPESQEQLTNIAAILKEYPNVNIKLGGYTDNTGSAAVNKKLSQDRADNVMAELVKLGVPKGRMAAEGYGPEHPVASNDTAEGRAENRRIAIRVTKK